MADPNPKYNEQSIYNKFQESCSEEGRECLCCPVGTVAVHDDCGNIIGCLTPNDAEHYNSSRIRCEEGYQKVIHPLTGEFIGCLTPEAAADALAQLSPDIDPLPTGATVSEFNLRNTTYAFSAPPLTATSDDYTVQVDRLEYNGPIMIQLGSANPAPSGLSLSGGPVIVMLSSESNKQITFALDNSIPLGVYVFDLEVIGGAFTKIIQVTLTVS